MYNRYIPQPDGSFRRSQVPESANHRQQCQQKGSEHSRHQKAENDTIVPKGVHQIPPPSHIRSEAKHTAQNIDLSSLLRKILPNDFDTGDLIVILLLLLMSVDSKEDQTTALLTIALYLFL